MKRSYPIVFRREEFLGQSPDLTTLYLDESAFDDDVNELACRKLLEFQKLEILELHFFNFKSDFSTVLSQLQYVPIRRLILHCYDLKKSQVEFLLKIPRLEEFIFETGLSNPQSIEALAPLPIFSLKVQFPCLTEGTMAAISSLSSLRSLTATFNKIEYRSLAALKILPELKELSLQMPSLDDYLWARRHLVDLGLLELKAVDGKLGSWYETGKEVVSRREFSPSSRDYRDGYEEALGKGDQLDIFDPEGNTVFSGVLSGGNDQEGVDSNVWQKYFTENYKAKLYVFSPTTPLSINVLWKE